MTPDAAQAQAAAAGAGRPGSDAEASVQYGAFVPQGWKLEYSGWSAPDAWQRSVELAQQADGLGFDHIWVYDHVETVPRRERTHCFEAYTMLAALSQRTSRVRLGQMVTCVGYRNVGLLAKEVACVDVFSGGRVILGIGAGWYEREYQAYGFRYPTDTARLATLREALEVIPRLWSQESVSYEGSHVRLDGAFCEPEPIQRPPEIWVGGGGERVTLRIEAKHAAATNWQVGLDGFVRKSGLLERYCDEIGRDPATIRRTHGPDCRIFDTDDECRRWCESDGGGQLWGRTPTEDYLRDNLVGTVDQVAEKAQAFVDAGCRGFVLWFRDAPSDESMRRWMDEVVPLLSA